MTDAMTGPFETEREARELPAVQAVYQAFDADPGAGKMAPHTRRMLDEACAAAGVGLGAFDRRVLAWLSGWEPETAAVVAGLITRAHQAGRTGSPEAAHLTGAQRARVEHARRAATAATEEVAAKGDITDPATVHAYAFGYTRQELAGLLEIIDDLTGGAR